MKFKFLYSIVIVFSFCNCTDETEKNHELTGTYIRFTEHEFGREYDTIEIRNKVQGDKEQVYEVKRKWKYERVLDGEKKEPEYKQSTGTIRYQDQAYIDEETGLMYRWDTGTKQLFIGTTSYKRL